MGSALRQQEGLSVTRYVAFLRANKVGGRRVKMAHLRKLFEALGLFNVKTLIAGGNVIFDSSAEDTRQLEHRIEDHLRESLGYEVATFVRTASEPAEVALYSPFDSSDPDAKDTSLYIAFLHAAPSVEAEQKLTTYSSMVDDFRIHGREVY